MPRAGARSPRRGLEADFELGEAGRAVEGAHDRLVGRRHQLQPCLPRGWTRRVHLVRGEGRGVSSQYVRGGKGGGGVEGRRHAH